MNSEANSSASQSATRRGASETPAPAARFNLDSSAVLLDVDGTLLDIAPTPDEVRVPERLRAVLRSLSEQTRGAVAFVSGRPIADLDRIFAPLRLPAVGGHGAEIRIAADSPIRRSQQAVLDPQLRERFAALAAVAKGILIEDKTYSLAIHYRLAPQAGGQIMKRISTICQNDECDSLEILPGKSVIEIKPSGFDKGSGLRELMTFPPFAGRRPLFIGDDVTDNAAFAVLPDFNGIGFSVGGIVPGATFNFDGPSDVRLWLEQLSALERAEGQ